MDGDLEPGTIGWHDLTVEDAETARDFYEAVAGWRPEPVELEGYQDFNMRLPHRQEAVAGVCHARGSNADLPPQWLMYVVVESLDRSLERCREMDGEVVAGPRGIGGSRYAVIRDPAGAVCALYEPAGKLLRGGGEDGDAVGGRGAGDGHSGDGSG